MKSKLIKHPSKKTFAIIQKSRMETALEEGKLSERLTNKIDNRAVSEFTCPVCGQFIFSCLCHIPFI